MPTPERTAVPEGADTQAPARRGADAATEAAWVRQALAGDPSAFAALVRAHQSVLRAWLRRLLQADAAWVDDLAQETWLRAYRNLAQWRGEAGFRTWLLRIAVHVCRDHQRLPSVWAAPAPEGELEPDADRAAPDGGVPTAALADAVALRLDVEQALGRLSEAQRCVVLQVCWADLSLAEAAAVLEWPLGTVKSHYRRALQVLAKELKDRA